MPGMFSPMDLVFRPDLLDINWTIITSGCFAGRYFKNLVLVHNVILLVFCIHIALTCSIYADFWKSFFNDLWFSAG